MTDNGNRREKVTKPIIKNKITLSMYIAFWTVLLIMFSALLVTQAGIYNTHRADLDRITAEADRERAIYQDLNDQMLFFDSDSYIEALARERLGMVRPDEIVFRNIAE